MMWEGRISAIVYLARGHLLALLHANGRKHCLCGKCLTNEASLKVNDDVLKPKPLAFFPRDQPMSLQRRREGVYWRALASYKCVDSSAPRSSIMDSEA